MKKDFSRLFIEIGYQFNNLKLIETALTHSSAIISDEDNDKLEFLGDRVLGLIIAKKLYENYPNSKTGDLAQRFNHLVRSETLFEVAEQISLGQFIISIWVPWGGGL